MPHVGKVFFLVGNHILEKNNPPCMKNENRLKTLQSTGFRGMVFDINFDKLMKSNK